MSVDWLYSPRASGPQFGLVTFSLLLCDVTPPPQILPLPIHWPTHLVPSIPAGGPGPPASPLAPCPPTVHITDGRSQEYKPEYSILLVQGKRPQLLSKFARWSENWAPPPPTDSSPKQAFRLTLKAPALLPYPLCCVPHLPPGGLPSHSSYLTITCLLSQNSGSAFSDLTPSP